MLATPRGGVLLMAAAVAALAACGAPKSRPPRPVPLAGAGSLPMPSESASVMSLSYRIDTAKSELRVLVYRGGPMGRLGHNHVIVNRSVSGTIQAANAPSPSSWSLSVPAANFSVDEPQLRTEEGADFAAEVSDDARAGTRRNLLSAALLDAVHYPSITIVGTAVQPVAGGVMPDMLTAALSIRVAGHESHVDVPFQFESSGGQLTATGQAQLKQSALGLSPFSAMLGALQVEDEFTVKFRLVADRT